MPSHRAAEAVGFKGPDQSRGSRECAASPLERVVAREEANSMVIIIGHEQAHYKYLFDIIEVMRLNALKEMLGIPRLSLSK